MNLLSLIPSANLWLCYNNEQHKKKNIEIEITTMNWLTVKFYEDNKNNASVLVDCFEHYILCCYTEECQRVLMVYLTIVKVLRGPLTICAGHQVPFFLFSLHIVVSGVL